ncbi:MAG: DUF2950 domain-containing protein, partial [Planctomycetota bacterium]
MNQPASAVLRSLLLGVGMAVTGCASTSQVHFESPDEAAQALVVAVRPMDRTRLEELLGPDIDDLLSSGDPVADENDISRLLDRYHRKHDFEPRGDGSVTLTVGDDDWPVAIPLQSTEQGWRFDTEAGREEMLNRRIGANELSTIETCLAYADAQFEYVWLDPDGDGLRAYAQHIVSEPGTRNGLYWTTEPGEPPSPLGALVAEATEEGYQRSEGEAKPFHGYHYRILEGQGPAARDGAREYVINGRAIGGFAAVAWPATYGNSGVMTFIVNQDGVVYES